jgi:hypothetical protein
VTSAARRRRPICGLIAVLFLAAACASTTGTPAPTPGDIEAIAAGLAHQGIAISNVVAGDSGCADPSLTGTAISFQASGADQAAPVTIHLYSFRSRDVFAGRQDAVNACARSYVSDPATYEVVAVSPYIAAGQGPWAPAFKAALEQGLTQAAGSGG